MFKLKYKTRLGRFGLIETVHGRIETPVFLPVATAGAMKGITLKDLESLGAQILLANTYHLHLSPGEKTIAKAGGLHRFIGWNKPILTDSGGFQVFSLKKIRTITDKGVEFKDHRSGAPRFIGPVEAMRIQHHLGSDIIMCFDECPLSTAPYKDQLNAVERTLRWAKECKKEHLKLLRKTMKPKKPRNPTTINNKKSLDSLDSLVSLDSFPLLFGIVQGGLIPDLRKKCVEELISIGFDGYAIGGLAVGETEQEMFDVLKLICPILPENKPRYLMGVGDLKQIGKAIKLGVDMFDCVAPMREGRHGNVWLSEKSKLRIRQSKFSKDHTPIDPSSPSQLSRRHLKSYLHHLMRLGERYGETIACLQNMALTFKTMADLRKRIKKS